MTSKELNSIYKVVVAVHDEAMALSMVDFMEKHKWPLRTQVHLLHVIEPNPLKRPLLLPEEAIVDLSKDEEAQAIELLNTLCRKLYRSVPGIRIKRYLRRGIAKTEITKLAARLRADFIIVGSHGRRGLERLLLGSVASDVVNAAPCSTVVLRRNAEQQTPDYDSIVFTLDDIPDRMKEEVGIAVEN